MSEIKITHNVGQNSALYKRHGIDSGEHNVLSSQLCEVIHTLESELQQLKGAIGESQKGYGLAVESNGYGRVELCQKEAALDCADQYGYNRVVKVAILDLSKTGVNDE